MQPASSMPAPPAQIIDPPAARAPAVAGPSPRAVTVLRPSRGWRALDLGEVCAYRELLYFLVWRDLKVRYKQAVFGVLWAVLQPLLTAAVFALVFGRLARVPSDGKPYLVFSLAGLAAWTFFSNAVAQAANSLVGNQHLVTKVYFPRLVIPAAAVAAGLVDLAIALAVLLAVAAWYGILPTWRLLWVPAFTALATAAALGAGLWLSALNVAYRDVRHALPFLLQLWMFATPVAYASGLVGARWRPVFALNPMVGAVDGFRWAVIGASAPGAALAVSAAAAAALVVSGAFYFRRVERDFADVV